MRLGSQTSSQQRELDGLRGRRRVGGTGGERVERVDSGKRVSVGNLTLSQAESGEREAEMEVSVVGRAGSGCTRDDARHIVDDSSVVALRLETQFGLGSIDGKLRSEVRGACIDELSMVDAHAHLGVLDGVLCKLEGGGVVCHGSLLYLCNGTLLVVGLRGVVDEVLAHDNGSGSVALVQLPALLKARHALGVGELAGLVLGPLDVSAKGSRNKTGGLLDEVETGNAEEKMSSGVARIELDGALPSLSGSVMVAEAPETETDADARIRTSPAERGSILCVLVGSGLNDEAHLERVLVEFESLCILTLTQVNAGSTEQSKCVTRVLVEDGIKEDSGAVVLSAVGERDGFGKLIDVMLGIEHVGLRLVGGGLFVVGILGLLVGETLVACIVEDDLGCESGVVERKGSEKGTQRDGLCWLVGGKHLDALCANLDGFGDAFLEVELGCETRPVFGRRTFVDERFQEDLDIFCRRKRVEVKRDGLVDGDGKVERPVARWHGGRASILLFVLALLLPIYGLCEDDRRTAKGCGCVERREEEGLREVRSCRVWLFFSRRCVGADPKLKFGPMLYSHS